MALWRIEAKNSGNVACKDKKQRLEKGMFVETSTMAGTLPINSPQGQKMLIQQFLSKYGVEIEPRCMTRSHFDCNQIK